MKSRSPTLEGFRVMLRRPTLGMAEVAWRWSLGTAACLLLSFAFVHYLDTLPVSNADLLFLRSRQPFLISQTIAHLFRGSGFRLIVVMTVTLAAVAVGWVVAASLGRVATLRWLVEHFRGLKQVSSDIHISGQDSPTGAAQKGPGAEELAAETAGHPRNSALLSQHLTSLGGLCFLRVALTFAATFGCVGAIILAALASSAKEPHPGLAFLIMVPLVCLVWLFWSVLNWFLSLAPIFAVRDGQDTFGSVSAAIRFCRDRMGAVTAVGFWFGLAHLAAFILATTFVSFPIAFARAIPLGIVLGGVLLVTLLYFVVADFLYAGRLAAYVAITELPESPPVRLGIVELPPHDARPLDLSSALAQASDDPILSDLPLRPPGPEVGSG
jgi:hypothetical protein